MKMIYVLCAVGFHLSAHSNIDFSNSMRIASGPPSVLVIHRSHFTVNRFQLSRYYSVVFGCGLHCAYAARMIKLLCGSDF